METIVVDKRSWNRQNKSIIGEPRLATGCSIYKTKCRCVDEGNFETEIFAVAGYYIPTCNSYFIQQPAETPTQSRVCCKKSIQMRVSLLLLS